MLGPPFGLGVMEEPLTPRTREVLHAIVQSYVETGEPVASRTIARRRKEKVSAATIRNIMADLDELGYLDQPHTSAGRVPTAKAFRYFAQSLASGRMLADELSRVREELFKVDGVEGRGERTSHLLTEMTRNVGIFAAIPTANLTLTHIELVPLPDSRVLMVVVTRDGAVRNRVLIPREFLNSDDLAAIRNYVNSQFAGWTLSAVRQELGRRLEQESAAYDHLLRKLVLLYENGLLDIELTPAVFMEGASNLVGLDLHLTKEKLRDLLRALEQKKKLMELLDQFLAERSEDVKVQVGLGDAHPALRDFSLIGVTLELPGGFEAKMAVLGPMRMNYSRVMSAVLHVGYALRSLPH